MFVCVCDWFDTSLCAFYCWILYIKDRFRLQLQYTIFSLLHLFRCWVRLWDEEWERPLCCVIVIHCQIPFTPFTFIVRHFAQRERLYGAELCNAASSFGSSVLYFDSIRFSLFHGTITMYLNLPFNSCPIRGHVNCELWGLKWLAWERLRVIFYVIIYLFGCECIIHVCLGAFSLRLYFGCVCCVGRGCIVCTNNGSF